MESRQEVSLLDRRALGLVGVNWEVALYLAVCGLAFVLRFWDLGARILHHDESIHAVYSWYLYTGKGYIHNPTFHGPFLYHANALIYFLLGVSDYTARVAPAIIGLAMVGLPYLLRGWLGRSGALVTSFLLALSPSILYYSRSLRHDIFAATATVLLVVCLWRYVDERRPRWLYLAAGALVISFTNHELSYITVFIFVTFLVTVTAGDWLALLQRRQALSAEAVFLLVLATIVLPLFAPAVLVPMRVLGLSIVGIQASWAMWLAFAALALLATAIGCWWDWRVWPYAAIIFYGAAVLLFTGFLTNPKGVETGLLGSLQYWLTQHDVRRGAQPWYYYLLLLPLYEFLPVLFGLAGAVYAIWRRSLFGAFLVYWLLASLAIYSWAGEKMPWLVIHIAIPAVMLAGLFLGAVIDRVDWRAALNRGVGRFVVLLCVLAAVLVGLLGKGSPFKSVANPLEAQQHLLQWLALFAVLIVVGFLLVRAVVRMGRRLAGGAFAVGALVLLLPFWMHASWQVNFYNGDVPVEMLVYTQSSPDVGKVMREIERIGFRTGAGKDLKVAYDTYVSWPFEWYLRDYRNRNYYGSGFPASDAPIVLVGLEDNHDAAVKAKLGNRYVGQRYKLRWWFPEDYKSAHEWVRALQGSQENIRVDSVGLGEVLQATLKPTSLGKLWRYFVYRETLNPLGSTDFMMYVRKDLVSGLWGATATTGPALPGADSYESRVRSVGSVAVWGGQGKGGGQFQEPKNLTVAPDGSVYVADSRNNRIQKLDANGRFILAWGSGGTGQGQFAEPWGIAVDSRGDVYVADTWNHRVQKFDSSGRFLGAWGTFGNTRGTLSTPGVFFGPRAIAVDKDDRVYVVDTGNHRIQVFDSSGKFLAQHGGRGDGDGQFDEPVGIAIDKEGFIYVADTWNRRVQRFDSGFNLVDQWPIAGWESESVVNKPYLAVDGKGGLYVSDPENHRILKFSSTGSIQAVWGVFGSDKNSFNLPTGLACDGSGSILVADSGNHRIAVYPPLN